MALPPRPGSATGSAADPSAPPSGTYTPVPPPPDTSGTSGGGKSKKRRQKRDPDTVTVKHVKRLLSRLDAVLAERDHWRTRFEDLESAIAGVHTSVSSIQADLTAIQSDVSAVKAGMDGLRGQVAQAALSPEFLARLNRAAELLNDPAVARPGDAPQRVFIRASDKLGETPEGAGATQAELDTAVAMVMVTNAVDERDNAEAEEAADDVLASIGFTLDPGLRKQAIDKGLEPA